MSRKSKSAPGEVLVRCENVGKKFCRDLKRSLWYGLKDSASDILGRPSASLANQPPILRKGEFWANHEINFELRRGECLGLIGGNGAGKTTLLKVLSGLLKPDEGSVEIRGRVGAIIALGAGFNPVLTGRENIYVNGSILGISRSEIDQHFEEIVAFAELEAFIDAPVRTYSSGMSVRLGFAIASSLNPDVLIIDEVLAVGDANFRIKCYNRISKLLPNTAIIFVTHAMPQVARLCTHGLVLNGGRGEFHGAVSESIDHYFATIGQNKGNSIAIDGAMVNWVTVNGVTADSSLRVSGDEPLEFKASLTFKNPIESAEFLITFLTAEMEMISQASSWDALRPYQLNNECTFKALIPANTLGSGMRLASFAVRDTSTQETILWEHGTIQLQVENKRFCPSPGRFNMSYEVE